MTGEVPGMANTAPAVFFAPWLQLSEVSPACWACEGNYEDGKSRDWWEGKHIRGAISVRIEREAKYNINVQWGETHVVQWCRVKSLGPDSVWAGEEMLHRSDPAVCGPFIHSHRDGLPTCVDLRDKGLCLPHPVQHFLFSVFLHLGWGVAVVLCNFTVKLNQFVVWVDKI